MVLMVGPVKEVAAAVVIYSLYLELVVVFSGLVVSSEGGKESVNFLGVW